MSKETDTSVVVLEKRLAEARARSCERHAALRRDAAVRRLDTIRSALEPRRKQRKPVVRSLGWELLRASAGG